MHVIKLMLYSDVCGIRRLCFKNWYSVNCFIKRRRHSFLIYVTTNLCNYNKKDRQSATILFGELSPKFNEGDKDKTSKDKILKSTSKTYKTYLANIVSLSKNWISEDRRFSSDIEDISDISSDYDILIMTRFINFKGK